MPEALENSAGPIGPRNAVPPGPIFQRTDWLSFGVTVLVALVTYLATLAPEVTLEYSGFLSTSARYAGVAHPPGYPVWTIYSWLFVELLPFSNIALRVAIGSAVATALACGLVALMVSGGGALVMQTVATYAGLSAREQNLLRTVAGFVAGLGLGLSRSVWSMAVVAETWAVTFLLFSVILFLLTCWVLRPRGRWVLYAGFFVYGLMLTSNQELIVIIPALLMFVVLGDKAVGRDLCLPVALVSGTGWILSEFDRFQSFGWLPLVAVVIGGGATIIVVLQTRQIGLEWKPAILCVGSILLGLGCYFYLPITSTTNPPANWAYPRTVEGFVHAITRGQYPAPQPTGQQLQFLRQLWILAKQIWKGLGWPYVLFVPVPFCLWRPDGRTSSKWLVGLVAAFLCSGPLVLAWLNPSQDRAYELLIAPYFGAMFVVLSVWVGLGLLVVGSVIVKDCRVVWRRSVPCRAWIICLSAARRAPLLGRRI